MVPVVESVGGSAVSVYTDPGPSQGAATSPSQCRERRGQEVSLPALGRTRGQWRMLVGVSQYCWPRPAEMIAWPDGSPALVMTAGPTAGPTFPWTGEMSGM